MLMLKYGQFTLLPALNKLYSSVLSSGIYPESWSIGIITKNAVIDTNSSPVAGADLGF